MRESEQGTTRQCEDPDRKDGPRDVENGISCRRSRRIAVFISCDSFEAFYGGTFGLSRDDFVTKYRNDFVWEYSEALCRRGHVVVIYVLSYGAPELRRIGERLAVRFLRLPGWLRPVDSVLFRLRNHASGATLRDRAAFLAYGRGFEEALLSDQIDILYHQEIWTSRFDIVVRKVAIPVVGADHGARYEPWMARAKRRTFRRASRVLCQTGENLKRAEALGARAVLMQNGTDTDFFAPAAGGTPDTKTILSVGRLVEEQKRFTDLLAALQELPDFTLTLAGSGPDDALLRQRAIDLGVAERVHFAGFIADREALRSLYRTCGVFVSTSAWEAVALVVLEAMSCEAAVVVSRIPSFEALITEQQDGLLVPVGAVQDLAAAIRVAFHNRDRLGSAARQTVIERYASRVRYAELGRLLETV